MKNRLAYLILYSGLLILFNRCAQMIPISGGQRDTTPPKLAEAEPALNSTNFNSDEIVLKFDEFVQLKDLSNQLIVNPALKTDVELEADGKKILIHLKKEELQPNTTYRIFIGKAIADMTESNSIENFEYVFSTGKQIDTLQLKGNISDAFTNVPMGGMIVGLYSNKEKIDSVPFLMKPDYYCRSNENGDFVMKNLTKGKFSVYGISDLNKNGKYDGETEKIAFLDSVLDIEKDSSVQLKLFQEQAPKVYIKKTLSTNLGLFQILLNKPSVVDIQPLVPSLKTDFKESYIGLLKDTVAIYYKNSIDTLNLILNHKNSKTSDTLHLASPKKKTTAKKIKNFSLNTSGDKLALDTRLKITFPVWMDTSVFNADKLHLRKKDDSLNAASVLRGRWINFTTFQFDTILKEGSSYTLKIDTSAFFDINHLPNDSSLFNFSVRSRTEFGKVKLKLKFNKKQAYIVQLLNEQNAVAKEDYVQFSLSSSNAVSIDFTDVLPGTYTVKLICDANTNHKWDRGDVIKKKLPEEVIINSKQIKIIADWESEEEILFH